MSPIVIAVLARDEQLAAALDADAREWADRRGVDAVRVLVGHDPAAIVDELAAARDAGAVVPIVFVELYRPDDWGQRAAILLQQHPVTASARTVLVTSKVSLHGVDAALKAGAVQGMLTRPWSQHGLGRILAANVATFLTEHAPDLLEDVGGLFDDDDLERARQRIAQGARVSSPTSEIVHPLLDESIDDRRLEADLVRLLDDALGHPPRLRVSPGTVLIEAGEDVGGFYMILDGSVRLTSRTESGERILHERSTGAIVGLLSLATHRRALQRCQAVTEVRAIPITLDQLARALDAAPELGGLLTRVLVGSLARRLRRSDQMQVELDQSLAALSEARSQLVASARFATLGELSAGLAHELNNPTAALGRAVDHLLGDVTAVVDDPELVDTLRRRYASEVEPSSELRARRRELTDALGDRARADRLLRAGAVDAADARRLDALDDARLDRLAAAAHLGELLRNVTQATDRIQSLVTSLRAYARGDDGKGPFADGVDVAEGVRSALGLLAHRVRDVHVEVEARAVPAVAARPGALQQVWTNLLANALDAMDERGSLRVTVDAPDADHVRVRVHDDGPGIPADLLPRVFEPRFTTKGGTVRFGMGLGLSISRQLVADHGGTIEVESRPGDTTFTVVLPVSGPADGDGQTGDGPTGDGPTGDGPLEGDPDGGS